MIRQSRQLQNARARLARARRCSDATIQLTNVYSELIEILEDVVLKLEQRGDGSGYEPSPEQGDRVVRLRAAMEESLAVLAGVESEPATTVGDLSPRVPASN